MNRDDDLADLEDEQRREWQRIVRRMPALYRAAWRGDTGGILSALRKGRDVNALDAFGYTALSGAASAGHAGAVRLLLDLGADPNAPGFAGRTALLRMVHSARDVNAAAFRETFRALVEAGADVTAADRNGRTALMEAASRGYADLAELVLDRGADVNARDERGETALLLAVTNRDAAIVALLAGRGADPDVVAVILQWEELTRDQGGFRLVTREYRASAREWAEQNDPAGVGRVLRLALSARAGT